MSKNKQTKIIKRTLIVLFSAIAIISYPYFIGEFTFSTLLLNTNRPEPSIMFKWIVGAIYGAPIAAVLFLLVILIIGAYQWIISDE